MDTRERSLDTTSIVSLKHPKLRKEEYNAIGIIHKIKEVNPGLSEAQKKFLDNTLLYMKKGSYAIPTVSYAQRCLIHALEDNTKNGSFKDAQFAKDGKLNFEMVKKFRSMKGKKLDASGLSCLRSAFEESIVPTYRNMPEFSSIKPRYTTVSKDENNPDAIIQNIKENNPNFGTKEYLVLERLKTQMQSWDPAQNQLALNLLKFGVYVAENYAAADKSPMYVRKDKVDAPQDARVVSLEKVVQEYVSKNRLNSAGIDFLRATFGDEVVSLEFPIRRCNVSATQGGRSQAFTTATLLKVAIDTSIRSSVEHLTPTAQEQFEKLLEDYPTFKNDMRYWDKHTPSDIINATLSIAQSGFIDTLRNIVTSAENEPLSPVLEAIKRAMIKPVTKRERGYGDAMRAGYDGAAAEFVSTNTKKPRLRSPEFYGTRLQTSQPGPAEPGPALTSSQELANPTADSVDAVVDALSVMAPLFRTGYHNDRSYLKNPDWEKSAGILHTFLKSNIDNVKLINLVDKRISKSKAQRAIWEKYKDHKTRHSRRGTALQEVVPDPRGLQPPGDPFPHGRPAPDAGRGARGR